MSDKLRHTYHCDLLSGQSSHGVCNELITTLMIVVLAYSGHQSFSSSRKLNDFVGNITHSSILVPYHGWRVSHRTHHQHHGHVENDESWHPVAKKLYDSMVSHSRTAICQSHRNALTPANFTGHQCHHSSASPCEQACM